MRHQARLEGIPILLQDTVEATVPQWPTRLRRRWLRDFLPHWRPDLLDEHRLARYLVIALRRGWFDEATGARRWTLFIRFLERATALGEAVTVMGAVNGFNLVAAVLSPDYHVLDRLTPEDWRLLLHHERPLDASALTPLVRRSRSDRTQGTISRLASPILRVLDGQALGARGRRWSTLDLSGAGLRLSWVVEPFGLKAWDGVSEVGLDGGALVAWSRPLGLMARIEPPDFPPTVIRGEPTKLVYPELRALDHPMIEAVFAWRDRWVGRTADGAVACFESIGAP